MGYRCTVLAIILVAFLRCFLFLDQRPLAEWDETRNAGVVRELVTKSTFPFLTYDGKPFFEKPPLWYYLTGIVSLSGYSLTTLRLVSATWGFTTILIVFWIGVRWYGKAGGTIAAIVLLTTGHLFIPDAGGYFSPHTFRSADSDSLLIFCMVLAFFCFFRDKPQFTLGMVFSALGILAKGPMGIVPAAAYIIYIVTRRDWRSINPVQLVTAGMVFFFVLTPWYLVMIFSFGDLFIREHLGYHLFARIVESLEGHEGEWWFYISVLSNKEVFLGLEALFFSTAFLLRKSNTLKEYKAFAPLMVIALILLFITVTRTKLAWYVLPVYPFAALVIGNTGGQILKSIFPESIFRDS